MRANRPAEERLPWGPRPSSRHRQAASTTPRGIPTPRSRSVLDVSHVLDGFLRHLPSRACFIPLPRPGFALQGFVPLRGAVPGFPGPVMPSCRWARAPVTSERALDSRAFTPRGECGVDEGGLGPHRSAPLLGFLLLRVLAPAHRGNAFTSPPPTAFTAKNPSRLAPGVSPMRGLACLDSGCRPARAFRPEPPASFRKSGSRPAFQATHQAAGHGGRQSTARATLTPMQPRGITDGESAKAGRNWTIACGRAGD